MTLGIMTLSILTLIILTFGIMTLGKMTLCIKVKYVLKLITQRVSGINVLTLFVSLTIFVQLEKIVYNYEMI